MDQLDIMDFIRTSTRRNDTSTAKEAAAKVAPKASKGRMRVLEALTERGLTDFEIAAAIGSIQTSCGKRRGEARDAGWVEIALDGRGNEIKRPSPSGSNALVWQITEAGRKALEEFQRGNP